MATFFLPFLRPEEVCYGVDKHGARSALAKQNPACCSTEQRSGEIKIGHAQQAVAEPCLSSVRVEDDRSVFFPTFTCKDITTTTIRKKETERSVHHRHSRAVEATHRNRNVFQVLDSGGCFHGNVKKTSMGFLSISLRAYSTLTKTNLTVECDNFQHLFLRVRIHASHQPTTSSFAETCATCAGTPAQPTDSLSHAQKSLTVRV